MATPPNSLHPPPKSAAPSSFTSKKTRKATRLRSLDTRQVGVERPVVHVDPTTRKSMVPTERN